MERAMATRQHPPSSSSSSIHPSLSPGQCPASGSAPGLALLLLRSKHLLQENLQGVPGWCSPGNLMPAALVARDWGFGDPAGCSQLQETSSTCNSPPRQAGTDAPSPGAPRGSLRITLFHFGGEGWTQGAPPGASLAPLQHSACTNPAPPSQPPTRPRQPRSGAAARLHIIIFPSGMMFFRGRTERFVTKP